LCLSDRSAAGVDEVLLEKACGFPQSIVRENHRFRFVDRIVDKAAIMKAVQCIPINALPGAVVVMQGQREEREDSIVNRSSVDVHGVHPKEFEVANAESSEASDFTSTATTQD
jgi:hypothetical protein